MVAEWDRVTVLPPPFHNLISPCPTCLQLDATKIIGEWHLVAATKYFTEYSLAHLFEKVKNDSAQSDIYGRYGGHSTMLCGRIEGQRLNFASQLIRC